MTNEPVKRYDVAERGSDELVVESANGDYVVYEDVKAEIERLQGAVARACQLLHGVPLGAVQRWLVDNFLSEHDHPHLKVTAHEPLLQHPNALADHINAMCGWAETLAKAHGWRRENAGSFWSSYDAARAVANLQLGASRDASSEPASVIDWPNKCCTKCRKPLVYESQPAHYAGWRLDCVCWDEPPAQRT